MRKSFLFLLLLINFISFGQNCSLQVATTKVCLGNTLLFNVKFDAGFIASSYSWNFGNAATSTQSTPVYQYPVRGIFTPSVTVNFTNSTSCTVNGPPIQVFDKPKANFNITTLTTQCFRGNSVCINDLSTPGLDNAPILTRLALYGDGGFNNSPPASGPSMCYSYADPLGGVFTLVLEVSDTNNCMDRKEKQNAITIWSKMQELSFKTTYTVQCNQTPVLYTNTSKIPLSVINSYKWDFGDGNTATSPWNTFTHIYTQTGVFNAKLTVEDKNGCRDTFVLPSAGANSKIDSTIYLSRTSMCSYHNGIGIRSLNGAPAIVSWAIYKVGNPIRIDTLVNYTYDSIIFDDCGQYQIRMYVKLGNCFTRTDTTIKILGPKARIETNHDPIINSIQCEISDTVFFRGPPGDRSCFYQNSKLYRLWNFADPFAPGCTTDTKLGINVGLNCNYSKDSTFVKHAYTPGKEQCYYPRLILYDPVNGCSDTSETVLKLTQPDAGWDSSSVPIRRGLYYAGIPCLFDPLLFFLWETLPACGHEMAWVMPDSACTNATWLPIDTMAMTFWWTYSATCDPSGYITVGLILKNGRDKYGNPCYDTAWYHHYFKMLPLNPIFTTIRTNAGCGPWSIKLSMVDSIQDSLTKAIININSQSIITINFGPTDSIIPSQYYTFTKPGIKRFTVDLTNTRGCKRSFQTAMYFGFVKNFWPSKEVLCLSDSITLVDDVFYYNSLVPYWRDTLRSKAGKEQLYWDIGDGNGYSKSGPLPSYRYTRPGNYKIKMVAVDSLGCRDTMIFPRPVNVVDLKAAIMPMQPRYLCAPQILNFKDKSVYIDSSLLYAQAPYDTLISWYWTFGDNKTPSLLQNPFHDYTSNGSFSAKLFVQTSKGCKDSASIPIFIDGPRPSFNIISDTFGCAPFKVLLKNTTGYPLVNWVWFFRDQNNTIASTQLDTNVSFTYTKGGIYKIYLVGEDTLFNPLTGQIKSCWAVFPDSINVNAPKRQVRVIDPMPIYMVGPDTVCIHQPFQLIARSPVLIPGYNWIFGDSSVKEQKLWPDTIITHTYNSIGTFRAKLYPQTTNAICVDTAIKDITVSDIMADFGMDDSETPFIKFINLSKNAVRYEWDFGHPRSGSKNFSTATNPTHSYAGDNDTFLVCLKSFNAQDCYDSMCKKTRPDDIRLIIPNVFTPNGDNVNDAYDIDIIGYNYYLLDIYNRWGDVVYKGNKDGIGNDGTNWNGKNNNEGQECPEGVYFFVFKYRMVNNNVIKSVHGTITLIRD